MAVTAPTPQELSPEARAEAIAALPERIAFFDGVCSFCDGTVKWLVAHDPEQRLHFAPLQGETAATVRAGFPDRFPVDIDTFVYLEPGDDFAGRRIHLRSEAVFALADDLGGELRWITRFRWLPRWLTDLAYRLFASNRYRMFGKLEACDVPTPADRARLLP